jgi:hypothetical protein
MIFELQYNRLMKMLVSISMFQLSCLALMNILFKELQYNRLMKILSVFPFFIVPFMNTTSLFMLSSFFCLTQNIDHVTMFHF